MYFRFFLRIVVFACLLAGFAVAQVPPRDPDVEGPIVETLRQKAGDETVSKFVAATEAMDSGRYDQAAKLYEEVLKKAPEFDVALRRLGFSYVALGRRLEGLDLSERALKSNRSPENMLSRATSLLSSDAPNFEPSQLEIDEANSLARETWAKNAANTQDEAGAIIAQTLLMSNKVAEFEIFAPTYRSKQPKSASAAYFYALFLANKGDFAGAESEIAQAKELGLPDQMVEPLAQEIAKARDEQFFGLGKYTKYGYIAAALVGVWALGLAGLFVVGLVLSRKMLTSIEASDPNDTTGAEQSSLRKFYRRVVSIAGVYYYISQPFVIFLVIVVTGGVILALLMVGHIPIKLVLVLAFVGAASIFYMLKSLFTRVKMEDPGRVLTEQEAPGLWKLVRDVAATINTRPADEIRITHGTELAVYERGSFRAKMSDNADRVLILGTAILNGFDQNAFRAVLAHEYGHFSNRDTAGGDIAFRVENDIIRTAESMGMSGTATFYNLGFQFLRLFHFIFRRIAHGASRLQEILADRVAAYHFGAAAFRDGLNHVVRRQVEFVHLADKEVNAALGGNRPLQNLYEITVSDNSSKEEIEEEFKTSFERPTTHDDTHPSPRDRFRYIERIRSAEVQSLSGDVWELFADRAAIVTEMNGVIEKLLRPSYESDHSILGVG